MAFTLRVVKVPPNSVKLEEAWVRVFDFFRLACRSIQSIMEIYNLYDVATVAQLQSAIVSEIRKNTGVTNSKGDRTVISLRAGGADGRSDSRFFTSRFGTSSSSSSSDSQILRPAFKVIDMLLFKGMEELDNITEHANLRLRVSSNLPVSSSSLTEQRERS